MLDDQTFTERQQVAKQPGTCMNCHASVYVPYKKLGGRRPLQGLREDEPDAVRRGAEAGEASRSPASTATIRDDAAARHAPGFIEGMRALKASQGVPNYDVNTHGHRAGDARVRLRPVPRRVLLQGTGEAADLSRGRRACRSSRSSRTTTRTGHDDWTHAETRRAGPQGAASRVRDVEPGHPRALRRRLRRLPHAVQARRRAEDQRPPRAQPAAEHQHAPARPATSGRRRS